MKVVQKTMTIMMMTMRTINKKRTSMMRDRNGEDKKRKNPLTWSSKREDCCQ
jgi:hypothetical protein